MEHLETSRDENDIIPGLLQGYRFSVCETLEAAAEALEIRRRVYVEGVGYDIPVPDYYDSRSWLLQATHVESGKVIGSMRLTPRFAGPFELEEYFTLPKALRTTRCVEINRFAILPEHRKGKTFLPVVTLGLFKLMLRLLENMNARHMVIASKPEKIWTYEWCGFERTGHTAKYGALDAIDHELLSLDTRKVGERLGTEHPFHAFFTNLDYREVVLPKRLPALGMGVDLGLRQTA
jgi:N-acyl-L-homoserine lactone synthetase